MPQVPVYGGPQVAADPLRPVQARALDVSSGTRQLAQGLANLGEGIDRYQEREAQAQAFNAEDALTKQWLEWDSQARRHYVGEKANEYEAAAAEWWAKAPETVGTNLNPRARELVGRSLAQKRNSAMASVMTAAGAEKERHADQVTLADIDSTMQFGVTTGNIDAARLQVQEKVAALGARKGWTTELVQKAQGEYISQLHMAQIDKLDAQAGLEYFTAHADEIEYDKQGDLRKALERQVEIEQKQREADVEKAKRDAEEAASNNAWAMVAQGATKIPPSLMASLPGREQVQIVNALETRAQGREVKTDIGVYMEVYDAIGRGEPVDLNKYIGVINTADIKSLKERQGNSQQDGFLTDEELKANALGSLKIDKTADPNGAREVLELIDRRIREASGAKGNKPLTPDEKRDVIDSVVLDNVYVNSNWVRADPQKPAALLSPEETAGAYVMVNDKAVLLSVVPADKRMAIISARRARGLPVTEQAIVETYLRKYPNGQ